MNEWNINRASASSQLFLNLIDSVINLIHDSSWEEEVATAE
jgi:hypothetical protein